MQESKEPLMTVEYVPTHTDSSAVERVAAITELVSKEQNLLSWEEEVVEAPLTVVIGPRTTF